MALKQVHVHFVHFQYRGFEIPIYLKRALTEMHILHIGGLQQEKHSVEYVNNNRIHPVKYRGRRGKYGKNQIQGNLIPG